MLLCDAYGGKIADVAADATAFPRRAGTQYLHPVLFELDARGRYARPSRAGRKGLRRDAAAIMPGASYVNYCDLDLPDYATAYWGENLARLIAVKQEYDPDNLFHHAQSVPVGA